MAGFCRHVTILCDTTTLHEVYGEAYRRQGPGRSITEVPAVVSGWIVARLEKSGTFQQSFYRIQLEKDYRFTPHRAGLPPFPASLLTAVPDFTALMRHILTCLYT